MRKIAEKYIELVRTKDLDACTGEMKSSIIEYVYTNAPRDYKERFSSLRSKPIESLDREGLITYLSAIVFADRIYEGSIDSSMKDGTIERIFLAYLQKVDM